MCGFVGLASHRPRESAWLAEATQRLAHRGPDAEGFWTAADGTVALGHRRLSILDLSTAANQPMHDSAGTLHIVFNGEIYNHQELRSELAGVGHSFRTHSDTEVILAAYRQWGSECLSRFTGMFALAMYDADARQLLLARDRAGEKPLFYRLDEHGIVFASELKALLADPRAPRHIDPLGLECYLAFGYVPAPHCMLRGYRKLRPGEALLHDCDANRSRTWSYWSLPDRVEHGASIVELTDELGQLLETSVRRQMIADVPVAVLLSGGLDSSIVTAIAATTSSAPVRTFTVSFPGDKKHDESVYAAIVARHFGTEHTKLIAEPADVALLPLLARQYDEPIADSSMVPTYLVSRHVRESATVALGGDGGDELFGGYQHYSWMQWQGRLRAVAGPGRRVASAIGRALPVGVRGRNHLLALEGEQARSLAHINMYFDAATRAGLRGSRAMDGRPEEIKMGLWRAGLSSRMNAMRTDFMVHLPDDLLVKVDRASMLASLEVRCPFLDHHIVEFAFGRVPDDFKVNGRSRKILLRRLGSRLLPAALDLRRKQGFTMPMNSWYRSSWGDYLEAVLAGAPPDFIAPEVVKALTEGQRNGRSNTQRIFALAMLELWRREYNIEYEGTRELDYEELVPA